MDVIGRGVLAAHLSAIAARHERVVALAAGVSSTTAASQADFDREAELVRRTLAECRATRRVAVLFSTASEALYAPGTDGTERQSLAPRSPYGRHKLAMEHLARTSGADWLVLRLGHLVGEGQRSHQLLPALVEQVLGGHVRVHRGARRDLIDTEDAVAALDALLTAGVTGEVVNVVSGLPVPVEGIVDRIETLLGTHSVRERVVGGHGAPGPTVSLAKLRSLIGADHAAFDADYPWRLLDRYVPLLAATSAAGTTR
ncbi:NAD-dependent epimerase/dehydratase family protein [Streptomyces sp. NPDC001530]|uniref:NAD-dependent epimerase/dehydratase family protein n=1 Tax=Streptomyces sp. NPDC001530 TaxID=3364582 RepID=UPI003699419E